MRCIAPIRSVRGISEDRVIYDDFDLMDDQEATKQQAHPPTKKQLRRNPTRVGRNEPCPCGSGLKFKKCHLRIL